MTASSFPFTDIFKKCFQQHYYVLHFSNPITSDTPIMAPAHMVLHHGEDGSLLFCRWHPHTFPDDVSDNPADHMMCPQIGTMPVLQAPA